MNILFLKNDPVDAILNELSYEVTFISFDEKNPKNVIFRIKAEPESVTLILKLKTCIQLFFKGTCYGLTLRKFDENSVYFEMIDQHQSFIQKYTENREKKALEAALNTLITSHF